MPKNSPKGPKGAKKYQKVPKSANICQKVQEVPKIDKKGEFHCIGATIRTRREIQCLPYAAFFLSGWKEGEEEEASGDYLAGG